MPPKRRVPRQARSRAVYDAILEAAAQVLVERGYDKASTGRIAERAGVSVGSLYQYFADKDDVFEALTERVVGAVSTAGLEALATDLPVAERVAQGLRGGFEALERYPGMLRQLATVPGTRFGERIVQVRLQTRMMIAAVLHQHRGQITIPDIELGARVLTDATEGLLTNYGPDDDADALAEQGARLLLDYCGLRMESGR